MISLGSSSLSVNLQEQKAFQRERERERVGEREVRTSPPFFFSSCLFELGSSFTCSSALSDRS